MEEYQARTAFPPLLARELNRGKLSASARIPYRATDCPETRRHSVISFHPLCWFRVKDFNHPFHLTESRILEMCVNNFNTPTIESV